MSTNLPPLKERDPERWVLTVVFIALGLLGVFTLGYELGRVHQAPQGIRLLSSLEGEARGAPVPAPPQTSRIPRDRNGRFTRLPLPGDDPKDIAEWDHTAFAGCLANSAERAGLLGDCTAHYERCRSELDALTSPPLPRQWAVALAWCVVGLLIGLGLRRRPASAEGSR